MDHSINLAKVLERTGCAEVSVSEKTLQQAHRLKRQSHIAAALLSIIEQRDALAARVLELENKAFAVIHDAVGKNAHVYQVRREPLDELRAALRRDAEEKG